MCKSRAMLLGDYKLFINLTDFTKIKSTATCPEFQKIKKKWMKERKKERRKKERKKEIGKERDRDKKVVEP